MIYKFFAMEKWEKIAYMIAIYSFLTELRPLDPYITAYLIGPDGNLPLSEVAYTIEAIKSYSALIVSLIMMITSDYFLYKINIIILPVCGCISYFLMTGSPSLTQLRVSMVGPGCIFNNCVLSLSYLYAQIEDRTHYQMATSIVIIALQLGKATGNILAQIIVNLTGEVYTILPYCNIFTMLLAVIWACQLPPVVRKHHLSAECVPNEHSRLCKYDVENVKRDYEKNDNIDSISMLKKKKNNKADMVMKEMWTNFKIVYSDPVVVKRSLSYVMGLTAYCLILANINILYSYVIEKPGNHDVLNNGFAEALATLGGGIGAFVMGKLQFNWDRYNDVFTIFSSIAMGGIVISCYFYDHLILIYTSYVLFCTVFQAFSVLQISEIAKRLEGQFYCLVLEFNFFGSLIMVSIMTLFLVQFNFMYITIPGRFLFIGGLFFILGILLLFTSASAKNNKYTVLL